MKVKEIKPEISLYYKEVAALWWTFCPVRTLAPCWYLYQIQFPRLLLRRNVFLIRLMAS